MQEVTISTLAEKAEAFSDLVADAIIKKTQPMKDDMSKRQAQMAYGAWWLKKMTEQGLAKAYRVDGKWIYSRHQLDCLRAAERHHADLIFHKPV